jgi:hypothetical protein
MGQPASTRSVSNHPSPEAIKPDDGANAGSPVANQRPSKK